MLKKIAIAIFIILMISSVTTFVRKKYVESTTVAIKKTPPLLFTKAIVSKYEGNKLMSRSFASNGFYQEPNLLHLQGTITAKRYIDDKDESVKAKESIVFFNIKSLSEIFEDVKVTKIELKDRVRVHVKDLTLMTEYAEYTESTNVIETLDPVKVRGSGKWLRGDEGFRYDLNSRALTLFGNIDGVFKFEEE